MTTPATRCSVTAHRRITARDRGRHLRRRRCSARVPGLDPDRQRHGLHRPAGRHGAGGRNAFETRTTPARHRPEEHPTQPPHHLRQGRAVPADPQEVAARPTPASPTTLDRAPGPARRASSTIYNQHRPHRSLPHRATPATALHRPPQGRPRPPTAPPTPTTASAPTRVDNAGAVTLRVAGRSTPHRHRPNPRPNPRPPARPRPRTSRVINAATGELLRELTIDPTTRLPAPTPTQPQRTNSPNPLNVGSGYPGCPETSHGAGRQCGGSGHRRTGVSRHAGHDVAGHRGQRRPAQLGDVEGPSGHHCRRSSRAAPVARSPREYGVSQVLGVRSCWPATAPRARRRSSHGRGGRRPHRARPRPTTVELILRLRKQLTEHGLDAGADTIGWHLTHHHGRPCRGPRSTAS